MRKEVINIYQGKAFVLSNFSAHEVEFLGEVYKTAEHCYHCQRYTDSKILNEIKLAKSPDSAWEISQKYKAFQKSDFDQKKVEIMKQILLSKVSQHKEVKEFLLSTGEMLLEKQLEADVFWGTGVDGTGKNMLGKLWMEIRKER